MCQNRREEQECLYPQFGGGGGAGDDMDPLRFVCLSFYRNEHILRVRQGSFAIWSNRRTLKPKTLKPQTTYSPEPESTK